MKRLFAAAVAVAVALAAGCAAPRSPVRDHFEPPNAQTKLATRGPIPDEPILLEVSGGGPLAEDWKREWEKETASWPQGPMAARTAGLYLLVDAVDYYWGADAGAVPGAWGAAVFHVELRATAGPDTEKPFIAGPVVGWVAVPPDGYDQLVRRGLRRMAVEQAVAEVARAIQSNRAKPAAAPEPPAADAAPVPEPTTPTAKPAGKTPLPH